MRSNLVTVRRHLINFFNYQSVINIIFELVHFLYNFIKKHRQNNPLIHTKQRC
jgi:hypothetical protein